MQSFSRNPLLSAIIRNLFIKPDSRLICTITDEIAQYLFTNTSKKEKSKSSLFRFPRRNWNSNDYWTKCSFLIFSGTPNLSKPFFVYKIARNNKSTTSRVGERVQDRKKGISREPAHFHLPVWCALIYPKKKNFFACRDCVCVNREWRRSDQKNFFRSVPNNDLQVRLLFSFLLTASLFRLRYSLFLEFLVSLHRPRDNSRYFFLTFHLMNNCMYDFMYCFSTFSITLWLGFRANDLQELSTLENWE